MTGSFCGAFWLPALRSAGVLLALVFVACQTTSKQSAERAEKAAADGGRSGASGERSTCGDKTCAAHETCRSGECICERSCEGRECRDDLCGGECPCPEGYQPNTTGQFVPAESCTDTCQASGFSCGPLCGADCGACDDGEVCRAGRCECDATCDGSRCVNGCGLACDCGTALLCNLANACVSPEDCRDSCEGAGFECGTLCGKECGTCARGESCVAGRCVEGVSCEDCALKLRLVERQVVGGRIARVTLAVDYEPGEGEPRARIAELRIKASRDVVLSQAEAGEALTAAEKELYRDELTGQRFKRRADGSYQMLAYGFANTKYFTRGRVATLTFDVDDLGPVEFSLMRRVQTLAPLAADGALQAKDYDAKVVVTR